MKPLEYFTRQVYGRTNIYLTGTDNDHYQTLSHKQTITQAGLEALSAISNRSLKQVIDPKAAI